MLQGVTAFFAYMWWWLSCRMAELLDFFFLMLYVSSKSVTPFFHSPFLQRKCPVSKFPVLRHVLPFFSWSSSNSTTGLQQHKIFYFQKAYSDLYPRWATQKAYEQWNTVWISVKHSFTEQEELKFPEVQGLSIVGPEPKVFPEQEFLGKGFSWLKQE